MKTITLILFFLFASFSGYILAQGSWIMQNTNSDLSELMLTKAGSDCIIHTKSSSDCVYFFDIYCNTWTECNVGSQQNMRAVETGKHVVFAYSDSLLIAYSSLTSTFQYIHYSGNILSPEGTVNATRGYGCGDKAAYVWTDQNIFYVFDGIKGEWDSYDYEATTNASGYCNFWCGDNFVAGIFERIDSQKHKNVVYSLVTGTFSKSEYGGTYASRDMTGGYVNSFLSDDDDYLIEGYSAFTNQFYRKEVLGSTYINLSLSLIDDNWRDCRKKKVSGYTVTSEAEGEREVSINIFDTERAEWISLSFPYIKNLTSNISTLKAGGNSAVCFNYSKLSDSLTFYIYSGDNGEFTTIAPGIINPPYYFVGNDFVASLDYYDHAWFYNPKTNFSKLETFNESSLANIRCSTDYLSFCQYEEDLATMELWFYNALNDQTFTTVITKDIFGRIQHCPHSYIYIPQTADDPVVFYSSIHDYILIVNFDLVGPGFSIKSKGVFSWLSNDGSTLLFDAENKKATEFNTLLIPLAQGAATVSDSLALFRNGNVYDVYDATTGNATSFNLGSQYGYNYNGGNICLVSTSNYYKFYAFQKGRTEWVELIPSGSSIYCEASENTAFVVRQDKIFAFSPEGSTGIEEMEIDDSRSFTLSHNYPNPFTGQTTINWQLSRQSHVVLSVFDFTGRKINTLVDASMPPGNHKSTFDAAGFPAGIYCCQLQVDGNAVSNKMAIVK